MHSRNRQQTETDGQLHVPAAFYRQEAHRVR